MLHGWRWDSTSSIYTFPRPTLSMKVVETAQLIDLYTVGRLDLNLIAYPTPEFSSERSDCEELETGKSGQYSPASTGLASFDLCELPYSTRLSGSTSSRLCEARFAIH